MQKGFTPILIILAIIVVTLIGGGAYYLGTKKAKPITQTQVPSPTVQPSVDETVSWKTYMDQEFKYEFKYPEGSVSIKKNVNQVRLNKSAGYIFEVRTYYSKDPLNTWVQKQKANGGQFPIVNNCWSVSTVKFQNKDAFLIRSNVDDQECQMQVPMDEYIVKLEDTVYQIAFSKDPSDKSIIDQILSTFKFTNQNQAQFAPGEIVVSIKSGVKVKDAEQLVKSYNLNYKTDYKKLDFENKKEIPYDPEDIIGERPFFLVVYVPVGEENKWINTFKSNPIVKDASLNSYFYLQNK